MKNNQNHISRICKGEVDAYSEKDPIWIKTINCTSYTIIFDSDVNDNEYQITDKKGTRVGTLRNLQGFLFNFFKFKDVYMNKR
jgi:hypothetical protein